MKLTATSNPIIPKKITKGINVTAKINKLVVNNLNKNEDKIANNVWPATILAKSRNPKETALAKYDTNSIKTNKGTKPSGVPAGTKYEKNLIPWSLTAKIVTPKKIVTDNPKQTITELVTAKLYATLEIKLEIKTKINNE